MIPSSRTELVLQVGRGTHSTGLGVLRSAVVAFCKCYGIEYVTPVGTDASRVWVRLRFCGVQDDEDREFFRRDVDVGASSPFRGRVCSIVAGSSSDLARKAEQQGR